MSEKYFFVISRAVMVKVVTCVERSKFVETRESVRIDLRSLQSSRRDILMNLLLANCSRNLGSCH